MCGNGVMIGMVDNIINHRQNAIRKVQHRASSVCCVGAVGAMLRGTAVSRTVTTAILTAVAAASVCAYPSQFYNDKNFNCCTWRDIWRDTWRDGTNRMIVVYMLADGE